MLKAVAPYNFVQQAEAVLIAETPPAANRYDDDLYTGWFDVAISTRTTTYTRQARESGDTSEEAPPGFFHLADGTLALPGSSWRGMTRALFEILTASRLTQISGGTLFYRTFADKQGTLSSLYSARFNVCRLVAGKLVHEGGGWYLRVRRQATDRDGRERGFLAVPIAATGNNPPGLNNAKRKKDPRYKAQPLKAQPTGSETTLLRGDHAFRVFTARVEDQGSLNGWLIVPGPDVQERHHYQFVLAPRGTVRDNKPDADHLYPVPEGVYNDYLNWREMAHGARGAANRGEAPRKLEEDTPAFALLNEDGAEAAAIGANMMLHLRYRYSLDDVAAREPAKKTSGPDMAEAVFGCVHRAAPGQEPSIWKGRVCFEDARCITDNPLLDLSQPQRVPEVLSSPKPTAVQTYLRQPEPNKLKHWSAGDARIRGHKLYWHRPAAAAEAQLHRARPHWVAQGQDTRIEPVDIGVTFRGRVRFENLRPAELGALYGSLQLPGGMAHKLGMGKGLGMGSVRVEVEHIVLNDEQSRLRSLASHAGLRAAAAEELRPAYRAFVDAVHGPGAQTLWSGQTMLELAELLRSDPSLPPEATRQVTVDDLLSTNPLRLADDLARHAQDRSGAPQVQWLWGQLPTLTQNLIRKLEPIAFSSEAAQAKSGGLPGAAALMPAPARLQDQGQEEQMLRAISQAIRGLENGNRLDGVGELKQFLTHRMRDDFASVRDGRFRKANVALLNAAFPQDSRQWRVRWRLPQALDLSRSLRQPWRPEDVLQLE